MVLRRRSGFVAPRAGAWMGTAGYTVMELVLYLALLIAASWLLVGEVTPWRKVRTVNQSRVAQDIQSLRQAAYQWRDERSASDFTGLTMEALSEAGFISTAGTTSNLVDFSVGPDHTDSSLVRIEITLLQTNDDPAVWLEALKAYLRGVYEAGGITAPDVVWFTF